VNSDEGILVTTAVKVDLIACMELLIDKKADVNLVAARAHNAGWTALLACAHKGNLDGLCAILDSGRGVEVDIRDVHDGTSLMIAAKNGHPDCVELLCERKADVDARHTETGVTSLIMATTKLNRDCMHVLLDYGADVLAWSSTNESSLSGALHHLGKGETD
jgi:ankyrin repeat protein